MTNKIYDSVELKGKFADKSVQFRCAHMINILLKVDFPATKHGCSKQYDKNRFITGSKRSPCSGYFDNIT